VTTFDHRSLSRKLRELPGYDPDDPSFASPQPPRRAPAPVPANTERLGVIVGWLLARGMKA
jgi:hypothetical protein